MQNLISLKLYTTSHCHLCEQAVGILLSASIPFTTVEIAEDEALISLYGIRIPVLKRTDNLAELCWPFTQQDVLHFISTY